MVSPRTFVIKGYRFGMTRVQVEALNATHPTIFGLKMVHDPKVDYDDQGLTVGFQFFFPIQDAGSFDTINSALEEKVGSLLCTPTELTDFRVHTLQSLGVDPTPALGCMSAEVATYIGARSAAIALGKAPPPIPDGVVVISSRFALSKENPRDVTSSVGFGVLRRAIEASDKKAREAKSDM